ncbi:MAG: hypothetical protein AAGD43_08095 [Pseudomonadota bacterium]
MANELNRQTSTTINIPGYAALESVLQLHIRKLHEAQTHSSSDGEPLRGKDPWLGLMA